jgi:hypothetical protein
MPLAAQLLQLLLVLVFRLLPHRRPRLLLRIL